MPTSAAMPAPPDGGPLAELRQRSDGGTVNGHPRGPRAEELEAIVRSATPALQRCVDVPNVPSGVEVPVRVTYRILAIGRAADVELQGALPPDPAACVRTVIEGLRFPIFEGEPIAGTLPFSFRRDIVPAPPGP